MFCYRCGTRMQDGSRFCTACGADNVQQPAAPAAPVKAGIGKGAIALLAACGLIFCISAVRFGISLATKMENEHYQASSAIPSATPAPTQDVAEELPTQTETISAQQTQEQTPSPWDYPEGVPDGAVEFEGHYYLIYPYADAEEATRSTWQDVETFCINNGGSIALCDSDAEQAFLCDYIRGSMHDAVYLVNNQLPDPQRGALMADGTWVSGNYPSVPAAPYGVTAENFTQSSALQQEGASFGAEAAADGKLDTAWCEGAEGYGYGQSMTIEFAQSDLLLGFYVNGGYQKTEELYQRNSRPSDLVLTYDNGESEQVHLQDTMGQQYIVLERPRLTKSVTVTIEGVYPGTAWEDTLISEIQFIASDYSTAFVCEWDAAQ